MYRSSLVFLCSSVNLGPFTMCTKIANKLIVKLRKEQIDINHVLL